MELHRIFYYTIPPPPPPPPPLTGETFLRSMSVKGTEFFLFATAPVACIHFPEKKILAPPPQFCKFTVPDFARNRNKVTSQTPNNQRIKNFRFFETFAEELHVEHGYDPVQPADRGGVGRALQGMMKQLTD